MTWGFSVFEKVGVFRGAFPVWTRIIGVNRKHQMPYSDHATMQFTLISYETQIASCQNFLHAFCLLVKVSVTEHCFPILKLLAMLLLILS